MRCVWFLLCAVVLLAGTSTAFAHTHTGSDSLRSPEEWMKGYTLILVDSNSAAELAATADFITSQGGTVAIVLPPNTILGWITPEIGAKIIGRRGIRSIHRSPVNSLPVNLRNRDTVGAVSAFNDVVSGRYAQQMRREKRERSLQDPERPPMIDCSLPRPPIDKDNFMRNLRSMGADTSVRAIESGVEPRYWDNSNVMDGSVAVAVFLIESNGQPDPATGVGDPNSYSWSEADQDIAMAQVIAGLNWWVDQSRAFNLARPLRFTLLPYRASNPVCQQGYEPILRSGRDAQFWVSQIMANAGVSSGDVFTRVASFDRRIKDENRADWAFSIFIAYNPAPGPTSFVDGRASWAYLGGPFVNSLFRSYGWPLNQIISHETGHIFYACDEYSQPGYNTCDCNCAPEVRPEARNGNCEESSCNRNSNLCMMRVNEAALCPFTVAQIGWTSSVPRPIPTAPAALVATASAPTQVNLIWQDTSTSEDGFQVERRGGSSAEFTQIGVVRSDQTGYTDNTVQPNTAYAYRVRAFNEVGVSSYTAEAAALTPSVTPTLSIATADMPDATATIPYSRTLLASGGRPSYVWTIDTGSLPAGLTLTQSGEVRGTPTTAATSNFVVRVTDADNATATKALTILVNPVAPLTITTRELPRGSIGTSYSQALGASGGQTPYSWSIQSGSLPEGLTLNQSGFISGTPERAGTSSFVLRLTDAVNATATATLSIQVNPAITQLAIETASLPDGVVGQTYSQTLRAVGGNSPYRWEVSSGALPSGLALSEAGAITGIPLTPGEVAFSVKVSDQSGQSITRQLSIDIDPPPQLTIVSTALPKGAVGVPYRVELRATAGTSPYVWSRKGKKKKIGVLPDGITLSADGVLSGMPTTQGTFNFTVRVHDMTERLATKPLSIEIGPPPPPLEINTAALPNATQGLPYSARLEAGGGVSPYTWTIDSGVLPAGLTLTPEGVISGSATTIGTVGFTVRLRDAVGTSSVKPLFIVVVAPPPPLVIQTVSLPETSAEQPYSQTLRASGGIAPYTWSLASGSLGQGMNLSADGVISGTPPAPGTLVFVVRVTDSAQQTVTRTLAIVVKPADKVAPFGSLETPDFRATLNNTAVGSGWALDNVGIISVEVLIDGDKVADAITGTPRPDIGVIWGHFPNGNNAGFNFSIDTTRLSNGEHRLSVRLLDAAGNVTVIGTRPIIIQNRVLTVISTDVPRGRKGEAYNTQLLAANGRPPYVWSIITGSLPAGLSLDASGRITGVPSVYGTFRFGVRVVDSLSTPAIAELTMTILPDVEPLRVITQPEAVPAARTGVPYDFQLTATGGRSPYQWSVTSGSLPPGLSLGLGSGRIAGTPTQTGTFSFVVRITDTELTAAVSGTLTITVTLGPLSVISVGDLESGRTGSDYSLALQGTGGEPPYTWSMAGGSLPPGLSLGQNNGVISGRPTQVGSFIFTVRITDSTSATATSGTLRLAINAGPLSILSSGDLAGGRVGQAYSHQLQLNGGRSPYTWEVATGSSLPAGLSLNASTGVISGTPTTAGTVTFAVRLTDGTPTTVTSGSLRITTAP